MGSSPAYITIYDDELAAARSELDKAHAAAPDVEVNATYDDAIVFSNAVARLLRKVDSIGPAILKCLWEMQRKSLFLFLGTEGEEYNTLAEWADEALAWYMEEDDNKARYVNSLILVAERVFGLVEKLVGNGEPFVDRNGQEITVELLLDTYGTVSSLIIASEMFVDGDDGSDDDSEITQSNRQELLDRAIHESRTAVKTAKARMKDQGSDEGNDRLTYSVNELPSGRYTLVFPECTAVHVGLIRSLLVNFATELIAAQE